MGTMFGAMTSLLIAVSARMLADARALEVPASASSILNPLYSFLISVNPIVLLILGVIVFFAGKLAKFAGIVLVVLGLVDLLLPYLLKAV